MKFEKVITEVEKLDLMKFRTPLQKAIQILKRHRIYISLIKIIVMIDLLRLLLQHYVH